MKRKLEIIIKENEDLSTVGIRFVTGNAFVGDYEKFECAELTEEQILSAVQGLLVKLLPLVPKEDEQIAAVTEGKSLGKFKRTEDGKFVLA